MDRKVGIFGGTFNPIHFGHLRAAEEVREKLNLAKILFIPSCNPPLKDSDLAAAEYRYEMVRASVGANPFFEISDIECRLLGKSYTVETVRALQELSPEDTFSLILGIDSFLDIPAWYQPDVLLGMTDFVVISRPGFRFSGLSAMIAAEAPLLNELDEGRLEMHKARMRSGREAVLLNITPLNISATAVRRLVSEGRSIKYLLPESVESYIISNNLYRERGDYL